MARTVVCISHAAGAGGEEVGRLVAERLGFLYVNEEIVARAAAKGGVDAADVADEERRKSLAARALNAIAQGGGEAWTLGAVGPLSAREELDSDDIRSLIRETIEQTAARGNAVIVAPIRSFSPMFALFSEFLHIDLITVKVRFHKRGFRLLKS